MESLLADRREDRENRRIIDLAVNSHPSLRILIPNPACVSLHSAGNLLISDILYILTFYGKHIHGILHCLPLQNIAPRGKGFLSLLFIDISPVPKTIPDTK